MADKRQPKLMIAVGKKGIGKTYTTLQMLKKYALGNPAKGIPPRRVLIFDVNNEYPQFKTISIKHIAAFSVHPKIEIRRVPPFDDNGKKMGISDMNETLNKILSSFSNGMLLVEDITRYVSDSINMDIIGNLATQRHINCDVIIHFQIKGKAGHPKILGMTNFMRIHKTTDNFDRHKDKFSDWIDLLKVGEKLVEIKNKKLPKDKQWFYCYADFDRDVIYGDFTKADFTDAIKEYISENEKSTIKLLLNKKDATGKNIYTYEKAYTTCVSELVENYYGNKT